MMTEAVIKRGRGISRGPERPATPSRGRGPPADVGRRVPVRRWRWEWESAPAWGRARRLRQREEGGRRAAGRARPTPRGRAARAAWPAPPGSSRSDAAEDISF